MKDNDKTWMHFMNLQIDQTKSTSCPVIFQFPHITSTFKQIIKIQQIIYLTIIL